MYKLDLPVDMKETAAIQRRRNAELQRQSRIFNARIRTIGVNMQYLKFGTTCGNTELVSYSYTYMVNICLI